MGKPAERTTRTWNDWRVPERGRQGQSSPISECNVAKTSYEVSVEGQQGQGGRYYRSFADSDRHGLRRSTMHSAMVFSVCSQYKQPKNLGKGHSLCVEEWRRAEEDSQNRVFSWGTGGYGRLGHNSPDEELYPREIIHFGATMVGGTFKLNPQRQIRTLAAGSTFTLGVSKSGCLYYWGKMSNSSRGESTMYPKQVMELCSYKCDKVACGNNLVVVTADDCVAGWGVPTSGLLGFEVIYYTVV